MCPTFFRNMQQKLNLVKNIEGEIYFEKMQQLLGGSKLQEAQTVLKPI